MFWRENFGECLSKDVWKTGKAFSCPWLLIHRFFNKRILSLRENSFKPYYFIDGKHGVENFNTPICINFHDLENSRCRGN